MRKRTACILITLLFGTICWLSGCNDTNMHIAKGTRAWSGECVIDITKNSSTEPVKVAEASLFIKGDPFEYTRMGMETSSYAYGTEAVIAVHGTIVPNSIKRQCFQRDESNRNSCIYEFDISREGKKYHVELPLAGFISKGYDFLDIETYWLDYPRESDVKWIEIR